MEKFQDILEKIKIKLHAKSAHMNVEFPYFINKQAALSPRPLA